MHPGPVNRGVELSAEVVDSPQALITSRSQAGVVVRMAVLYELLAGAPAPTARRGRGAAAGMSAPTLDPRATRPRRAADPRRPRARPARGHRRAARRAGPRRRDRRARRARRSTRPTAPRSSTARGSTCCPRFVDPHVHLRTPGQEHKEDLETGTAPPPRAASARSSRCPTPTPSSTPRRSWASLRERGARATRASRSASWPAITRGLRGEELTEMAELRDAGALGFTDDGRPVADAGVLRRALQYQRLSGGVSRCTRRTRRCPAPARCTRARSAPASASPGSRRLRVDDRRPRRRARRLRGRPHPLPAPACARVGRGARRRPRPPARRSPCEATPAPPHAHRRGRAARSTRASR